MDGRPVPDLRGLGTRSEAVRLEFRSIASQSRVCSLSPQRRRTHHTEPPWRGVTTLRLQGGGEGQQLMKTSISSRTVRCTLLAVIASLVLAPAALAAGSSTGGYAGEG